MTTPEQRDPVTPAEELLDAARIVLEIAHAAESGRWVLSCEDGGKRWVMSEEPRVFPVVAELDRSEQSLLNGRWIALANPLIGPSLAAWFEREAKVINRRHPSDDNPALNLARVIRQRHEAMQGGED